MNAGRYDTSSNPEAQFEPDSDDSVLKNKLSIQTAATSQINRLMEVLEKDFLSRYTPCAELSDEQLIEAIAVIHVELILIHPFREGNGRLSRLLANVMAMQASQN